MLFPKLVTTPSIALRARVAHRGSFGGQAGACPSIHRVLLDKRGSLVGRGLLPSRPLLAMMR
jgi:hypothetical protein